MKQMKILVVDDERAVRESLRRALELEGYEIELAADGREALERLEADSQPDALILDVLMPGLDGLEVCRRLRRAGSRLPVLMLTARYAVDHLRARVGLRLRVRLELARCLRRLPAPQDGGRRQAAPDPHRPRRRVRPARGMSFRARLTLVAAAAVALAVVLASVVVWLVVRNQLYREVDNRLKTRAVELANSGLHPETAPNGKPFLDTPPGTFLGFDYVQAVE